MNKCYYCGVDIHSIEETTPTTDNRICCTMCAEDLPMCGNCGRIITDNAYHYDEDTGNYCCDSCY